MLVGRVHGCDEEDLQATFLEPVCVPIPILYAYVSVSLHVDVCHGQPGRRTIILPNEIQVIVGHGGVRQSGSFASHQSSFKLPVNEIGSYRAVDCLRLQCATHAMSSEHHAPHRCANLANAWSVDGAPSLGRHSGG